MESVQGNHAFLLPEFRNVNLIEAFVFPIHVHIISFDLIDQQRKDRKDLCRARSLHLNMQLKIQGSFF